MHMRRMLLTLSGRRRIWSELCLYSREKIVLKPLLTKGKNKTIAYCIYNLNVLKCSCCLVLGGNNCGNGVTYN